MQKLRHVNETNAHTDARTVSHTHKMWAEWIENRNQFASIRNWQSSQKLVKRTNRDKRILTPPPTHTNSRRKSEYKAHKNGTAHSKREAIHRGQTLRSIKQMDFRRRSDSNLDWADEILHFLGLTIRPDCYRIKKNKLVILNERIRNKTRNKIAIARGERELSCMSTSWALNHFHLSERAFVYVRPQTKTYVCLVDCVSCATFFFVDVRSFAVVVFFLVFLVVLSRVRFILSLPFHKQTSLRTKIRLTPNIRRAILCTKFLSRKS